MPSSESPRTALERAETVLADWRAAGCPGTTDELLDRNDELRDVLEPMLTVQSVDAVPGTALGDYRILQEIGRGGMGTVFEAEQISLGRRVALKVLPRVMAMSQSAVERFQREAHALAQLRLPGVVQVHGVGSVGDYYYLAMELVRGAPLDVVLSALGETKPGELQGSSVQSIVCSHLSQLAWEMIPDGEEIPVDALHLPRESDVWSSDYIHTVVRVVAQVAESLQGIHDAGIVHRDVKPGNIMLREDGSAVLTDFGLAREEGLHTLTASGDFAGTPHYFAPELIVSRQRKPDGRADVFSLGATLYELLTLRRAFAGANIAEVIGRIVSREPIAVQKLNPAVSRELAAVVHTAMEKDPDKRYASAAALAEDLWSLLEGRPVSARPLGYMPRLGRWVHREPSLAIAVFTVFCSLGLGLFISFWSYREARASERAAVERETQAQSSEADTRRQARVEVRRARERQAEAERQRDAALTARDAAIAEREAAQRRAGEAERALAELRRSRFVSAALQHPDADEIARRWLADIDLAVVDELAELRRAAEHELWPIGPETVGRIDAWLERASEIAERVKPLRAGHARHRETAPDGAAFRVLIDAEADAIEQLSAFVDGRGDGGEPWGSSLPALRQRRSICANLHQRTIVDAAGRWRAATEAVTNGASANGVIRLVPQLGLLPIGIDPGSGLLEFAHVLSGEPPERDADGKLVLGEESSIVLVLIPPGRFWFGAQATNPDGLRFDPDATDLEAPPRQVDVEPFLIAKHAVTQAQWRRLTGREPSRYGARQRVGRQVIDGTHPVEAVDWDECVRVLGRYGLSLPPEVEWEYACRARRDRRWATGDDETAVERAANLADRSAAALFPELPPMRYSDGYGVHAPVFEFAPNAFGLHGVHGNVREWCQDVFARYGEAPADDEDRRVLRGGGFLDDASGARASKRTLAQRDYASADVGVRAARRIAR